MKIVGLVLIGIGVFFLINSSLIPEMIKALSGFAKVFTSHSFFTVIIAIIALVGLILIFKALKK